MKGQGLPVLSFFVPARFSFPDRKEGSIFPWHIIQPQKGFGLKKKLLFVRKLSKAIPVELL
jgi:hypothetical protein